MESFASVGALIISMLALLVTVVTGRRQIMLMHGQNLLAVLSGEGDPVFAESRYYVRDRLAEHSAEGGITGLPEEARRHVRHIGAYLDSLGKMVAHGAVAEDLVIGGWGTTINEVWPAMAPFVYAERRRFGYNTFVYFENLAARVVERPPRAIYDELGLRRRPPAPEPESEPESESESTSA